MVSGTRVLSGGSQDVSGAAHATVVSAAGKDMVMSAGIDTGTVVSSGGVQLIMSAGVVSGTTLLSGATLTAFSGGIIAAGLTLSGGTAVISGSVAAGQTVKYVGSGGDLALFNLPGFGASVGGFGAGDRIDLGGLAYGGGETRSFTEAGGGTSGTLTVTDGGKVAHLSLLGSYVTSDFALSTDGAGGTLVKLV